MIKKKAITLTVNERKYKFSVGNGFGDVAPSETLTHTLRRRLGLTGSKESCDAGACGCCAVISDGEAIASCMALTVDMDGKNITTIEGLEDPVNGLDPIQKAFIEEYAFQCGYCTPGIIIVAKALFMSNAHPTPEEIAEALSGNYCRCISQYTVLRALNKLAGNENAELATLTRANDEVKDPIPVRQELFLSPYANGHVCGHSLD
ncbi:MAG: (2Fe-2S)-binding protein [Synergistaceae bacterium]|jgi:carbon-monoxide dehydrogenase small subunit|nr:(2Fe-2S)-binding protein [Synergistaceae bacterium]